MPILNSLAADIAEITAWRRDIHEHPELQYDVHRTAGIVADKLRAFGCDEVVTGLGKTGVVGVIKGRQSGQKVIGLRADMDALPIVEETNAPYASKTPGKMHACGHDGHTAMLLGAAQHLAATRNFAGTAVVIFQPAEEGGRGALAMVEDGLMTRFGIQEVYGMHNMPGIPVGQFAIRPGPMMAGVAKLVLTIKGKGTHAAAPHTGNDPVVIAAQVINQLQTIASRNVDPLHSVVVSICMLEAGNAFNVIPQQVTLGGTIRVLDEKVRHLATERVKAICAGIAHSFGAEINVALSWEAPVTTNDVAKTDFALAVARDVVGPQNVRPDTPPIMGGEDFAFMLNERPGAFIFVGNGDTAYCHHPAYDFNDAVIPAGVSYWVRLTEMAMPL
jgi:hippurate hydrolase